MTAITLMGRPDPRLGFYGIVYIFIYRLISLVSFKHHIFNNYEKWAPQVVPLQPQTKGREMIVESVPYLAP